LEVVAFALEEAAALGEVAAAFADFAVVIREAAYKSSP